MPEKDIVFGDGFFAFREDFEVIEYSVKVAFVSTNSVTQGEQVPVLWRELFEENNVHIDFAYRTFQWDSEATIKAHVHCIIVGFSCMKPAIGKIRIFQNDLEIRAENITPYLTDGSTVFIPKHPLQIYMIR